MITWSLNVVKICYKCPFPFHTLQVLSVMFPEGRSLQEEYEELNICPAGRVSNMSLSFLYGPSFLLLCTGLLSQPCCMLPVIHYWVIQKFTGFLSSYDNLFMLGCWFI